MRKASFKSMVRVIFDKSVISWCFAWKGHLDARMKSLSITQTSLFVQLCCFSHWNTNILRESKLHRTNRWSVYPKAYISPANERSDVENDFRNAGLLTIRVQRFYESTRLANQRGGICVRKIQVLRAGRHNSLMTCWLQCRQLLRLRSFFVIDRRHASFRHNYTTACVGNISPIELCALCDILRDASLKFLYVKIWL